MPTTLQDFLDEPAPEIHLKHRLMHPVEADTQIGNVGLDKGRDVEVALFPRTKEEHWFRGESSSGLTGYGVSEDVLNGLRNSINRVIIIEAEGRVIEYDRAKMEDGTVVAYAPSENKCVIGDEPLQVNDDLYHDRQRVLPVDESRTVYDREEVTLLQ